MEIESDILVIGAGLAGLMAARELTQAGHDVHVVDAAPEIGGRLQMNRLSFTCGADLSFDHGAQFITLRDPALNDVRDSALAARALKAHAPIGRLKDGFWLDPAQENQDAPDRLRGTPNMANFAHHLADGLSLSLNTRIEKLTWANDWTAQSTSQTFKAQKLILALPPKAAQALLPDVVPTAKLLPTTALSVAFDQKLETPFDHAFIENDAIGWMARQPITRQAERAGRDRWVVHATNAFSYRHRKLPDHQVVERLLMILVTALGLPKLPGVGWSSLTYFEEAFVEVPEGQACMHDPARNLTLCGDWCLGPRCEAALLSGQAAGKAAAQTI